MSKRGMFPNLVRAKTGHVTCSNQNPTSFHLHNIAEREGSRGQRFVLFHPYEKPVAGSMNLFCRSAVSLLCCSLETKICIYEEPEARKTSGPRIRIMGGSLCKSIIRCLSYVSGRAAPSVGPSVFTTGSLLQQQRGVFKKREAST